MTNQIQDTKPKSHMTLAIISTVLFLFFPLGLVAIFYAARVNRLWNKGEHEKAVKASSKAKKWSIAAIITGILMIIFSGLIIAGIVFLIASVLIPLLTTLAAALPLLAPLFELFLLILSALVPILIGFIETLLPVLAAILIDKAVESVASAILLMPLF